MRNTTSYFALFHRSCKSDLQNIGGRGVCSAADEINATLQLAIGDQLKTYANFYVLQSFFLAPFKVDGLNVVVIIMHYRRSLSYIILSEFRRLNFSVFRVEISKQTDKLMGTCIHMHVCKHNIIVFG